MLDMENVKVLGSITLPLKSIKTKCLCDDCGCEVNDSFGDPRIEVKTFDSMISKEPSSVRWICEWCADQQFGDVVRSMSADEDFDYEGV